MHTPCSAIILAGGLASRMGGCNKALVELDGKPLLQHVLTRIQPQVDDIIINANRDQEKLQAFHWPVLADRDPGQAGPLAGIAACLSACRHDWVLVCPCDTPFLPRDLVLRLAAARRTEKSRIAVAHDGRRLQPLCLLLHKDCLEDIEASLARGDYKMEAWCRRQTMAIARFSDAAAFRNLNTPAEVQNATDTSA